MKFGSVCSGIEAMENARSETLWCSPHCVSDTPAVAIVSLELFEEEAT